MRHPVFYCERLFGFAVSFLYRVLVYPFLKVLMGRFQISDYISPFASLRNAKYIHLGGKCIVRERVTLWCHLVAGQHVRFNPGVVVTGQVVIGNYVMIAANSCLAGGEHGIEHNGVPMVFQSGKSRGIIVGNDVWIGANVVVLDGVTIHDGVVVGAGSIVTKNVPKNAVVVGNPAHILYYRDKTC